MKVKIKKILKKMIIGIIGAIAVPLIGGLLFMQHPMFGKDPERARLEKIKKSPNYKMECFKTNRLRRC